MLDVLAAEGGYQAFTLHGGEWAVLIGSAVTALLACVARSMPTRPPVKVARLQASA